MDPYIQWLYVFTFATIVSIWFLLGYLNPFIQASYAIAKCALVITLNFFFGWIFICLEIIQKKLWSPIQKIYHSIHIPPLVKALLYLFIGIAVFYFDHIYGVKLFEYDETFVFFKIYVLDKVYWVSFLGIMVGGIFIGLATIYFINELWKKIMSLLDIPIRVSITVSV